MEIPKMDSFWGDQSVLNGGHLLSTSSTREQSLERGGSGTGRPDSAHSQYERNLNFATVAVEDGEYGYPKKKTVRDPLSHRIIEKRRRDRMNNCLADLSRLLPPSSLRKGRGRIEKTEIVELAIKHLRHLQCHPCPLGEKCDLAVENSANNGPQNSPPQASVASSSTSSGYQSSHEEQFRFGYQECLSEVMNFLVEREGFYAGDPTCVRLVKHLNNHYDTVVKNHWGNQGKVIPSFRLASQNAADFKKTGSSSSGYHPNSSSSGSDGNGAIDGEGETGDAFVSPVQNAPQAMNADASRHSSTVLDFEAENSCSSTPLSTEMSDVLSSDGKNNNRPSSKPPIPTIICSHSSNNSGSPANGSNGRSSDDGSANSSASFAHRYKFKSNIKQRFSEDCQIKPTDGECCSSGNAEKSANGGDNECDRDGDVTSDTDEIREERIILLKDAMMQASRRCSQSMGDEQQRNENKNMKQGSCNRQSPSSGNKNVQNNLEIELQQSNKPIQSISASTPSSADSSPPDKTPFSTSSTNSNSSLVDVKSSALSSSTTAPVSYENQVDSQQNNGRMRGEVEVKPTPEELLTAIHNISNPAGRSNCKTQLPSIVGGETSSMGGESGVAAFALHEKGLFYIPLTLDKSVVAPYFSKFDSGEAPPLYPVTISVCFLLNSDKRSKLETMLKPEILSTCNDPSLSFNKAIPPPIPLPMIPAGSSSVKSVRRGYRENPYLVRSFGHPRVTNKDNNGTRVTSVSTGRSQYQGSFPEPAPSTTLSLVGMGCGTSEMENSSSSGCGLSSTMGGSGAGGNSSGSSSCDVAAMGGNNVSRKRPLCSSSSSTPSMSGGSGGSVGYHSYYEKGSPSSHDFFNFHSNTHNLQVMAMHGHLANIPPPIGSGGGNLPPLMGPRNGQSLHAFPISKAAYRDEGMGFAQSQEDKRSKKARSVDHLLDVQ